MALTKPRSVCTARVRHTVHTHIRAQSAHGIQGTPVLTEDLERKRTNLTSGNEKFKIQVLDAMGT